MLKELLDTWGGHSVRFSTDKTLTEVRSDSTTPVRSAPNQAVHKFVQFARSEIDKIFKMIVIEIATKGKRSG